MITPPKKLHVQLRYEDLWGLLDHAVEELEEIVKLLRWPSFWARQKKGSVDFNEEYENYKKINHMEEELNDEIKKQILIKIIDDHRYLFFSCQRWDFNNQFH